MNRDEAVACTLSGPELLGRIKEWRDLASHALSRRVEMGRVLSTYPNDDQLLDRLRELIAAEAECCSFMKFSIEQRDDEMVVELTVPDEMSEAVAVMLGLVTGNPAEAASA